MLRDPREELKPGTRLGANGRYRIEALLGLPGGFGITYRATDTLLGRIVAIKEAFPDTCLRRNGRLTPGPDWNAEEIAAFLKGFLEEGRCLAGFDHPGIVRVYDIFEENGTAYLVMKFIAGQTLHEYVREYVRSRSSLLPVPEALQILHSVGAALEYVHRKNWFHRDLNPRNLMRQEDGSILVIDFGAARQFVPNQSILLTEIVSRGFAAPEQYLPRAHFGPSTDVYGLSAVFYWLLTGKVPQEAPTRLLADQIDPPQALRSEVPTSISDAVMAGLQIQQKDRPQTVQALLQRLTSPPPPPPIASPLPQSPGQQERVNPVDGAEMVWIPPGTFQMGGNEHKDEKPVHPVRLSGYWMYRYPVTVAQYRRFCDASSGKYTMPLAPAWGWQDDHPMVNVSWEDSAAYCHWAGVSLPTEAQWEHAARGGLIGKAYPWGDVWDPSKARGNAKSTSRVGSYPANGYGLYDMSGNVWEWCSDWYAADYYQYSPQENPPGPTAGNCRVLRGGSWNDSNADNFRCADRNGNDPDYRDIDYGFRCAVTGER